MDATNQDGNLSNTQGGTPSPTVQTQDGNLSNQSQGGVTTPAGQDGNLNNQGGVVSTDTGNKSNGRLSFKQAVEKKVNKELGPLKEQLDTIRKQYNDLYETTVPEKEKQVRELERLKTQLQKELEEKNLMKQQISNEKIQNYIVSQLGNECLYKDELSSIIHNDFELYDNQVVLKDTTQESKSYFDNLKVRYAGMFKTIKVEGNGLPTITNSPANANQGVLDVDSAWKSSVEHTKKQTEIAS